MSLHCDLDQKMVEVYSHFVYADDEDKDCYQNVCHKFEELCQGAGE